MARKLIDGDFTKTHTLKIYRNSELNEFSAVVFDKTTNRPVAEYFTDDKEDIKATGRDMLAALSNI